MTDFTNIQSALRSRAEYLKGLGLAYTRTDGDMMYSAAIYIERLERDKSQLVEQVASYARAYDKAELVLAHMDRQKTELNKTVIERDAAIEQIDGLQRDKTALVNDLAHARNERLRLERTEAGEKIAAITAERDAAIKQAIEQRDAYSRSLDDEVQMRNDLRAKCDALAEALSRERLRNVTKPRHYVESHVARLDRTTRRTWNVRDNTQPVAFAGTWTHKAVAHADTLELANRICTMLNESADSKL